jgi:aminoglycoside phosphotransferase family enzyme/predicted kinase
MKPGIVSLTSGRTHQEELLPFLLDRHSYPHRPRQVRLVQTHASFVLIADPFAYKVKKDVNFGFLDFSTLEKRRHFCQREVVLNRRLCPRIYLGVIPISRVGGNYTFGKGEEVVEWAVKMRKLSNGHFLNQLLEHSRVTRTTLNRVVRVLNAFYLAQHPNREIESWGRIDRLKISTDENFRQVKPFVGQTLSQPALETIRFYTDAFYMRNAGLFSSRIRERWIRDCHGDLHLEHIYVTPRSLYIYDCIEFNDRFRYVDVASDLAFLAMDLDYEGRPDLSCHFVSQMAKALQDGGMGRLIDFYKCYRAFVRGKVESLHSVAHAAPEHERKRSADSARRYFRLALQYAVAGSQPLALVVMGRIASGKSSLARALSHELGWEVFSSDHIRKTIARLPLYQRGDDSIRARLYSPSLTERTYEKLLSGAEESVARGRSVILDATFARQAHRDELRRRFDAKGIPFRVIETQADDQTVRERLRRRETESEQVSDARLGDFERLSAFYEPLSGWILDQRIAVRTDRGSKVTLKNPLRALVDSELQ